MSGISFGIRSNMGNTVLSSRSYNSSFRSASTYGNTVLSSRYASGVVSGSSSSSGASSASSVDYTNSFLDYMTMQSVMSMGSMDGSSSSNSSDSFDLFGSLGLTDSTSTDSFDLAGNMALSSSYNTILSGLVGNLTDSQKAELSSSYDFDNLSSDDVNKLVLDLANMGNITLQTALDFATIDSTFDGLTGISSTSAYKKELAGSLTDVITILNSRIQESQVATSGSFGSSYTMENSLFDFNSSSIFGTDSTNAYQNSKDNYLSIVNSLSQLL